MDARSDRRYDSRTHMSEKTKPGLKTLQSVRDINDWHEKKDPWNYETTKDDQKRKDVLLSELPRSSYESVLDIGCGQGFVTRDLPGKTILGVDVSEAAVKQANENAREGLSFQAGSVFDLDRELPKEAYDLVVITGVLYDQYIANGYARAYQAIDHVLKPGGHLVSVHIDEWYRARFPYLMLRSSFYSYREFWHRLEIYAK